MNTAAYILTFVVASSLNWSAISIQNPPVSSGSNLSVITIQNIIILTNRSRFESGESFLGENTYLDSLAQTRAEDLESHGNFSHVDSRGEHSYQEVDTSIYPYVDFGENLAVLYTSAITEQDAWMNSPEHKDNILNPRYRDIGVGIVHGTYEGSPAIWVAVEFGDR